MCASLDAWAIQHGQAWVVPSAWPYDDDELITCAQVAELCHVKLRTVYTWHERGLPYVRTPEGIRVRVGDLKIWQRERRQARIHR